MDIITIRPYREDLDKEQTKREMDIHADGFKQGYDYAIVKAYEWMKEHQSEIQDAIEYGWDRCPIYDSYYKSMMEE